MFNLDWFIFNDNLLKNTNNMIVMKNVHTNVNDVVILPLKLNQNL